MYYTMMKINLFSFEVFQAADAGEDASADAAADINNRISRIPISVGNMTIVGSATVC